jgi:hypothetical protein
MVELLPSVCKTLGWIPRTWQREQKRKTKGREGRREKEERKGMRKGGRERKGGIGCGVFLTNTQLVRI